MSDKAIDTDKAVVLDKAEANNFTLRSTLVLHSF